MINSRLQCFDATVTPPLAVVSQRQYSYFKGFVPRAVLTTVGTQSSHEQEQVRNTQHPHTFHSFAYAFHCYLVVLRLCCITNSAAAHEEAACTWIHEETARQHIDFILVKMVCIKFHLSAQHLKHAPCLAPYSNNAQDSNSRLRSTAHTLCTIMYADTCENK
jgi:hypothetical protein